MKRGSGDVLGGNDRQVATVAPGHVGLTPLCDSFIPAVSGQFSR